jgi:hypothetical protein
MIATALVSIGARSGARSSLAYTFVDAELLWFNMRPTIGRPAPSLTIHEIHEQRALWKRRSEEGGSGGREQPSHG